MLLPLSFILFCCICTKVKAFVNLQRNGKVFLFYCAKSKKTSFSCAVLFYGGVYFACCGHCGLSTVKTPWYVLFLFCVFGGDFLAPVASFKWHPSLVLVSPLPVLLIWLLFLHWHENLSTARAKEMHPLSLICPQTGTWGSLNAERHRDDALTHQFSCENPEKSKGSLWFARGHC